MNHDERYGFDDFGWAIVIAIGLLCLIVAIYGIAEMAL